MALRQLLAGAFILASTSCFAQATSGKATASQVSLGPVVSLGSSWVSNLPGSQEAIFSPAFGLGLMYSASEHWGLGSKLMVSSEGYRQNFDWGPGYHSEATVRPTYLRLPIEVNYFFGEYGDRVRPKIYAGPSLGARLSETVRYSGDPLPSNEVIRTDGHNFSDFDAGLTFGAGANVRVGRQAWLNLDGGYYHGLVDVHADNDFNANRNLRLNVGMLFGL